MILFSRRENKYHVLFLVFYFRENAKSKKTKPSWRLFFFPNSVRKKAHFYLLFFFFAKRENEKEFLQPVEVGLTTRIEKSEREKRE